MTDRFLLLVIGAALFITAVGLALGETLLAYPAAYQLCSWGPQAAEWSGLALLLRNGTLITTPYFRLVLLFVSLILVGVLFKIEHWAGADLLLISGLAGEAVAYTSWFYSKKAKKRLDILKLLWVLTAIGCTVAVYLHWVPKDIALVPHAVLWLAILDFVYTNFLARPVPS